MYRVVVHLSPPPAQASAHLAFHPGDRAGALIDLAVSKVSAFRDFELACLLKAIGELGLSPESLGGAPGRLLDAIEQQPGLVARIAGVKSRSAFVGALWATVVLEVRFWGAGCRAEGSGLRLR